MVHGNSLSKVEYGHWSFLQHKVQSTCLLVLVSYIFELHVSIKYSLVLILYKQDFCLFALLSSWNASDCSVNIEVVVMILEEETSKKSHSIMDVF